MGGLGELAFARAVGPGQGRGGSPELEKMAVGKLVEAGEDGCGGREKGQPLRALRFTRAPANPSAYGGVVAGSGGNGIASRRTLDLVCFFSFFGKQNSFFLKLECAAGNLISCTRTL
jgi:hypothetical protein